MRKLLAAAAVLSAASITTIAVAQIKPLDQDGQYVAPAAESTTTDARSLASDQDVGEARRYYRGQCERYESHGFCECVTAGVAQALMPAEVRMAGRTIGERITAQGDAPLASQSDDTAGAESSAQRIEMVEGHYADACARFRG